MTQYANVIPVCRDERQIGIVGGIGVAFRGCLAATQQLTWSRMACAHLAAAVPREAETTIPHFVHLRFKSPYEAATRGSHCGLRPLHKAELDVAGERFTSGVLCSVDILDCQGALTEVLKRLVHRDSSRLLV